MMFERLNEVFNKHKTEMLIAIAVGVGIGAILF